jgi:hypothetical protein
VIPTCGRRPRPDPPGPRCFPEGVPPVVRRAAIVPAGDIAAGRRSATASPMRSARPTRRRATASLARTTFLLPGNLVALTGELSHAERLVPLLGPPGHGGVGARSRPRLQSAPVERRNELTLVRAPSEGCYLPDGPAFRGSFGTRLRITPKMIDSAQPCHPVH